MTTPHELFQFLKIARDVVMRDPKIPEKSKRKVVLIIDELTERQEDKMLEK